MPGYGAGGMTWQLRALAALPEDLSLVSTPTWGGWQLPGLRLQGIIVLFWPLVLFLRRLHPIGYRETQPQPWNFYILGGFPRSRVGFRDFTPRRGRRRDKRGTSSLMSGVVSSCLAPGCTLEHSLDKGDQATALPHLASGQEGGGWASEPSRWLQVWWLSPRQHSSLPWTYCIRWFAGWAGDLSTAPGALATVPEFPVSMCVHIQSASILSSPLRDLMSLETALPYLVVLK